MARYAHSSSAASSVTLSATEFRGMPRLTMKCGRCQHENSPGAKFCAECAAPLARVCANCGAQLSATAKFCSECAHPAGEAGQSAPQRFGGPEAYTPKH